MYYQNNNVDVGTAMILINTAMEIVINDQRKINAVQDDFNKIFPYLKLEFFSKSHNPGEANSKKYLTPHNKTIGEYRLRKGDTKTIVITPEMTVNDLEQRFGNIYGLGVQVFRQSGRVWLETTVTDSWTLREQNRQGEELSKVVH